MPNQDDKKRRKLISSDLKAREREEFNKSLPMDRQMFRKLFDHLNGRLKMEGCTDTLKITADFLIENEISDIVGIKKWLNAHGGYCDCEVLANVEEQFEN